MQKPAVAVVVGGSTGIGAATAKALAKGGAHVVIAAPCSVGELEPLCMQIRAAGGMATGHTCDVTERSSVDGLFRAVVQEHGRVDVVVNSAGVFANTPAFQPDYAAVDRIIGVNFLGGVNVAYSALAAMRPTGGVLVSVTSTQSIRAEPGSSIYAATKAAMAHFIASLTPELQHTGIRALCVAPGATRTPMTEGLYGAQSSAIKNVLATLDKRHGGAYGEFFVDPELIAEVIVFAASEQAKTLQGTNIIADQGYSAAQGGIPGINVPE